MRQSGPREVLAIPPASEPSGSRFESITVCRKGTTERISMTPGVEVCQRGTGGIRREENLLLPEPNDGGVGLKDLGCPADIIIIMYIYHALINALCAHMIHINLNMIFYTHVGHRPTKTVYKKQVYINYYKK